MNVGPSDKSKLEYFISRTDQRLSHIESKIDQILAMKLQRLEDEKVLKEASDARLDQIGTGDRSERIRTYNFPQTRITDHRIGLTIYQLDQVMSGDFEYLIDPLIANFQAEALKKQATSSY